VELLGAPGSIGWIWAGSALGSGLNGVDADSSNRAHPTTVTDATATRAAVRRRLRPVMVTTVRNTVGDSYDRRAGLLN
jgi:hypothetical protein